MPFDYNTLFSMPVREHSDYYTLKDVILNGQAIDKNYINLLFAIKKVGFRFILILIVLKNNFLINLRQVKCKKSGQRMRKRYKN